MKKNIAVVWGGYSSEIEISEKSARVVFAFLDAERYNLYRIRMDKTGWAVELDGEEYPVNKNDFSFARGRESVRFDFAYIIIHGTPGEDGVLQGYFDMLRIPYSSCGVLSSALTFSKFTFNNFLRSFGYRVADSVMLRKGERYDPAAIAGKLGLPLFVKPNIGGSSFATTKVKETAQLRAAVEEAFGEAPEALVECFVPGREVTCGCYRTGRELRLLPLTEIISRNEFFDFQAKYKGEVEEITPARISDDLTREIQRQTEAIYQLIDAKGFIRADYIISDGVPFLLEVNTVPGMTETSFIPQQLKAAGLDFTGVLTEIIEYEYDKLHNVR